MESTVGHDPRSHRRESHPLAWTLLATVCGLAAWPGCASQAEAAREPPASAALLPAGLRRLTAAEYDRTLLDVVGLDAEATRRWPTPPRTHGFTRDAAELVTPVFASVLHEGAAELARRAVSERLPSLVPCAARADQACAAEFLVDFGRRAFRRPLTPDELARYLAVFDLGAAEAGFAAGVELVLTTLFESAHLLYVTELGSPSPGADLVRLDPYEVASFLSYSVAGAPPDRLLLDAAEQNSLDTPQKRAAQARRLLSESGARHHYRRFVTEWLGIDGITELAKDERVFSDFAALRPVLLEATHAFVDRVMITQGGSLSALLTAPFDAAALFGGAVDASSDPRIGLLQQPSFLTAHAAEADSAPVRRGVAVLRRVLCRDFPSPAELGIEVVPPPPDATATTRERFEAHSEDPACAQCHAHIDPVGFSFEEFDAIGLRRGTDAGRRIDTSGAVQLSGRLVPVQDSADLAHAIAGDPEARRCLARQVFRYMTGRSEPGAEATFEAIAAELPGDRRDSVLELVQAFVKSDLFVWRRLP